MAPKISKKTKAGSSRLWASLRLAFLAVGGHGAGEVAGPGGGEVHRLGAAAGAGGELRDACAVGKGGGAGGGGHLPKVVVGGPGEGDGTTHGHGLAVGFRVYGGHRPADGLRAWGGGKRVRQEGWWQNVDGARKWVGCQQRKGAREGGVCLQS